MFLQKVAYLVTIQAPRERMIKELVPAMNIGETIRTYRLQKGMSQGDIEKRTGLLGPGNQARDG